MKTARRADRPQAAGPSAVQPAGGPATAFGQAPRVTAQGLWVAQLAASPRGLAQAASMAPWTSGRVMQLLSSKQKKLLDPIKQQAVAATSDTDRWTLIKQALDADSAGTDKNVQDGAKYLQVTATKPPVAPKAPVGPLTPFVSLAADVENALYTLDTGAAKIRYKSAEKPFEEYSGGKSVDVAVEEAIAGLDLSGSITFKHSRHDFQPSSEDTNLQVQLGGATDYRRGKGDTSSTLVVIDSGLWDALKRSDPARLKLIVQAAHRQSFANSEKVELRAV